MKAAREQSGKPSLTSRQPASPQFSAWLITASLCLYGFVGSIGQWIPGDSVSVATGQTLPQAGLWCLLAVCVSICRLVVPITTKAGSKWPWALGVGLLVWMALSTWMVFGRGNLRFAVNTYWQWIAAGIVFSVSYWLTAQLNRRSPLVIFFLGLAIATSFHAIYQYVYSMPRDRQRYKEEPELVIRELGLDAPVGSATRLRWDDRLQSTEPIGPYALTNSLAGFLAPCAILLLALLVETHAVPGQFWRRSATLVALGLVVVVLGLTKSRTAWLATLVGTSLYCVLHPAVRANLARHFRVWLAVVVGLVAFAAIWIFAVDSRILTEAPKSIAFRWQYWQSTLVLIAHNLTFGVGPGNFQDYYATYKLPNSSEVVFDPHSFLLETIATGGIAAGILLMSWLASVIALGWRELRDDGTGNNDQRMSDARTQLAIYPVRSMWTALGIGCLMALLTMLVVPGLVGPGPEILPYLVGVPMGLLWMTAMLHGNPAADISPRAAICALIAGLVHLLASGGWLAPGVTNVLAMLAGIMIMGNRFRLNSSPIEHHFNWTHLFTIAAWLFLFGAFLKTAWEPTQRALVIHSRLAVSIDQAKRIAFEAAAADPWNPEYRAASLGLAFVELNQNVREGRPTSFAVADVEKAISQLTQSDPHSWRVYFEIGRQCMGLASEIPKLGELAKSNFQRASELSPQDASCHLQAALCYWLLDEQDFAKRELAIASRIDQETPHRDQKLASQLVWWPINFGPRSETKNRVEWQTVGRDPGLGEGWVRAEPVADLLRTELN